MSKRVKIPQYAKLEARKGLRERQVNRAGLTQSEAKVLGIQSGVERAKQILNRNTLSEEQAKQVARFYARFKDRGTARAETALKLWGGRTWGKFLYNKYYG